MLPDLSPHLHTEECNILVQLFRQCQKEHRFRKFFGICSDSYVAVSQCFEIERRLQRKNNGSYTAKTKKKPLQHIPKELYTPKMKKLSEEGKL
uniref:COX assembly mitochondrial protein n=1 Tax=Syphacia muris TaxID=451379 RepID=A0A0N5AD19_9BILA